VLGGSKEGGNLKLVSRLGDLQIIQTVEAGSGDHEVVQRFDAGLRLETANNRSAIVQGSARLLGGLAIADVLCLAFALLLANQLALSGQPMDAPYALVSLAAPFLWVSVFAAFRLYSTRLRSKFDQLEGIVGARSLSPTSRQFSAAPSISATIGRADRYLRGDNRHGIATSWGDETSLYQAQVASALGVLVLGIAALWWLPSRSMAWLLATWVLILGFDLPTRVIRDPAEVDLTGLPLDRSPIVGTNGSRTRVTELGARLSDLWLGSKVLLRVSPPKLVRLQSVIKRGLDVVLAAVLLIATLPISITIAAIIAISCGLPVLFKQKRVTKGGRPFTMLKFRTMRMNANRLLSEAHADQTVPFFKVEGDPRITRIGAFLRKCSLDELPQLLNVFRGDMSLVGPRPLPVEQVEANQELLMARHEVRAGITGWWQVNGRNNITPDQAVALDKFYVENWSLALDLRILLKTPRAVLTRRGAY